MAMAVATSPESAGSVPPHNEEAEASVLGAILLTEQALDGVLLEVGLRPDHFYRPRHQLIFSAIEDVLHDEMDKLVELSKKDARLTGVASGFNDLDDLTGGFQPGNLIVLAARPAMGKSSLATNFAENAALDHGVPVTLFSLEMSETELAHRFLASQARVSSDELRKGRVKADRWPKVNSAAGKLAGAPLYIDDSSDLGVLELRAKARRLAARHGLGLVIVDYLQLMRPDGRADSRVEQIGQISRGLKILARELHVPVVAVSQLSRAVESRNPPIPMLSDLRESGCLPGDSRVYLPDTGEYRPIRELVGTTGFQVMALNTATWKLEKRECIRAFATGRKPVLRMSTRLGRTIRATPNHKFLAFDGWKRLDEVEVGEHLALPRSLPGPAAQRGLVVPALAETGVTTRGLQAGLGHEYCGTALYKRILSRERAARVARVAGYEELRRLSESDVYWDSVVSIE